MKEKGKTILIEGTDCSGKETQTKKLLEKLAADNIPIETMGFPRYHTPTGRIIGQCYLGKEGLGEGDVNWFGNANNLKAKTALLYYLADRVEAEDEIRRTLESGTNLILDRYVESNMAHQGGKIRDPEKRKEMIDLITNLEYGLYNLPKPDETIFLFMPYEAGMILREGRNEKADGHESSQDHLKNAQDTYLELSERFNWKKIDCAPNFDGTKESIIKPNEIHEMVYEAVKKVLN